MLFRSAVLADAPATKNEFPYKKILIAVLVVVAVIACALLVVNAMVDSYGQKLNNGVSVENAKVDEKKLVDEYYSAEDLNKYDFLQVLSNKVYENYLYQSANVKTNGEGVLNFILTVNDAEINYDNPKNQLAVVMLLSIKEGKATFVRMNSTTAVAIPGAKVAPLYDAYRFGGTALLAKTVQENYGIEINGYVDMKFDAFMKAIKEIGGLQIVEGQNTYVFEDKASLFAFVNQDPEKTQQRADAVVKALRTNVTSMKVFDLRKALNAASADNGIVASISDEDFGNLLSVGTKMFATGEASAELASFGMAKESSGVDSYWGYEDCKFINCTELNDYAKSIKALQTLIYGE